jgi:integrase
MKAGRDQTPMTTALQAEHRGDERLPQLPRQSRPRGQQVEPPVAERNGEAVGETARRPTVNNARETPASPQRRSRGSQQIYRDGIDRGTGKPRYFARFTINGKRHHPRLEATSMDAARAELVDRIKAVREGRPFREPPKEPVVVLTVRDLAQRFCGFVADKHRDNFKKGAGAELREPEHYRRQAWSVFKLHVLPFIGGIAAPEVKPGDVKRMKRSLLDAKKHNRRVQEAMKMTQRLFSWAIIDEELIDRDNPCSRIKKPQTTSSTEFYTPDEVKRLIATAAKESPALHPLVAFAFYTGCRKGEIAALRRRDIDFTGGRIVVQRSWKIAARKKGRSVTVMIHPHLDAILRKHLAARGDAPGDTLVFPDPNGRMRDKYDLRGLDELVTAAKVRRFKRPWHSFRHAHATELATLGASLLEIRDALGQSTLQMAASYTSLASEHVRKRIDSLPTLGPIAPDQVTAPHDPRSSHKSTSAT